MKIVTKRLVIRPFTFGDDVDLYEMCSDINTARDAGWKPHKDLETSKNILFGYIYGDETFAISLRDGGKVIGTISLYRSLIRKNIHCRELGFCLNKKYRHQGFMTEAVSAVLDYGFNHMYLDLIMVCHHEKNYESQNVIKKFPFTYEGTLRKYRKLYDETIVDGVMYSMTKEEYRR